MQPLYIKTAHVESQTSIDHGTARFTSLTPIRISGIRDSHTNAACLSLYAASAFLLSFSKALRMVELKGHVNFSRMSSDRDTPSPFASRFNAA